MFERGRIGMARFFRVLALKEITIPRIRRFIHGIFELPLTIARFSTDGVRVLQTSVTHSSMRLKSRPNVVGDLLDGHVGRVELLDASDEGVDHSVVALQRDIDARGAQRFGIGFALIA